MIARRLSSLLVSSIARHAWLAFGRTQSGLVSGMKHIDYIIVGAGSAGCTLAARLTEDAGANVLLLEAGGWDRNPWIKLPFAWGKVLRDRIYSWNYETEPEGALDNRRVECARGKVIGGSSSINAMAYVRGHRADYDRWAASGLPGWSYADVLPYFRRQERWEGGANEYRGGDGPLTVETSRYQDPLVDAYLQAGRDAGHPSTADYNGAQQDGFGRMQMTIRHGHRCSAAVGYLRPALGRTNLQVETGALATRIVFEGTRAVGVEYLQSGERKIVACRARGDPRGRFRQLAADLDAVRGRRSGATESARHRAKSAAARRRQEPAGPSRGSHYLCAQRARTVAAQHAARSSGAERHAGARVRQGIHHQPARRHHGIPAQRCRREPARRATAVHRRAAVRREALSRAVRADRSTTASAAASWCCGPRRAARSR